jgi:hypothetical protein
MAPLKRIKATPRIPDWTAKIGTLMKMEYWQYPTREGRKKRRARIGCFVVSWRC